MLILLGVRLIKKSTNEICYFLGSSLVSWASKKHNSIALSTTKVEYIITSSCYGKIL